MLPLPRGAVWQTLFLMCAVLFIYEVRSEGRVVCYYTNWSVYRPGTAKYNPQNINPYLCTHLVYAFGGFTKDNQMKPFDKYQDIEQGGYAKFTGLKTYNKQLKTMIAIGGWNEASSRFSPLMANSERRQQFIKNILKFLRQNHFDGLDLDWEYPAHREGGKLRDRDNYAQFVQELRAEFERESQKTGRPRLLLTMAVPAGIEHIEKGYDIPKLNKYLDWFNLLTYDFHSSHEPSVNHHAPLFSLEEESEYNYDSELNIDYSVKFYLKAGADRDKLVLGIPTYGRSYTLINEESTEIGAPAEAPGDQGDATREKGYLAYYEICQNLKEDPEWTVVQPNPNVMGPYAYRRNQWVGYDDEAIVRKKAEYAVKMGLGGIMFWAIDNDDFRGTCTGKPYPLIEAAKEAMLDSLGLGINEVAKPSSPKKPLRSRSRENTSSTRNRIGDTNDEKPVSQRRLTTGSRKRVQSSTTTTPPSTTIRLTEPEGSSLYIGGRTTTPPPPTTPDPGSDFKCEDEGFFQHPRDCKKYYWCLDSGPSGLGIVAHQFTCPSGLYFNPAADSCDFARNVPCKIKKSTTAAPVTTHTTTTARPTASANRITSATSRTSFFRTTSTTTTTPEPEPESEEIEYEDEEIPTHVKDSEEDPKVIKELIELIRRLGGIEELEKHLLRKDDGSISIKDNNAAAGVSTTASPISKNLYEKVLSKPNTFNSFRNRFTSSTLFRNSGTTKTDAVAESSLERNDEVHTNSGSTSYSKYSSVVRGNSRQGPQNEGIEKLPEFEGFLKEKKKYVTINRNRGSVKAQTTGDEDEEIDDDEVSDTEEADEETNTKEEVSRTTRRPINTATPSYTSIRRTRPTTLKPDPEENENEKEVAEEDEERKTERTISEKKSYVALSRNRNRVVTTEEPEVTEKAGVTPAAGNRYKYFDRTRPTKTSTSTRVADVDDDNLEADVDEDEEEEEEDQQQNVTVHLKASNDSTRKSQTTTTTTTATATRTYASIGRRTTTTTQETPTTTTETPTTTPTTTTTTINNLATTTTTATTNDTPEPIETTTIATNPTTTSTTTSTPTSIPTSTTTPIATTPTAEDSSESTTTSDTMLPLSLDINALVQENPTTTTTESGLDTPKQETQPLDDGTREKDRTTTRTQTTYATAASVPSDRDDSTGEREVTTFNNNLTKTQYKFNTRSRNTSTTTTTTTNTTNTTNSTNSTRTTPTINNENTETSPNRSSSATINNSIKYSGGRRQQQDLNEVLNRKSQIQQTKTKATTTTTTITEPNPTNEFLGTVSSPRPFGFPRRRARPTSSTTIVDQKEIEDSTSVSAKKNETAVNNTVNKVSFGSEELQVHDDLENHKLGSTSRTQTDQFTHKHVVVVDGNRDTSLRHVVDRTHSLSNTHTADHDDEAEDVNSKSFTWRDQRRPTKEPIRTNKDHFTTTATLSLTDRTGGQHLDSVRINTSGNQLNVLADHSKDETVYKGKYRGKSLDEQSEQNIVVNSQELAVDKFTSRALKIVPEEHSILEASGIESSLSGDETTTAAVESGATTAAVEGAETSEAIAPATEEVTTSDYRIAANSEGSTKSDDADAISIKTRTYTTLNRNHDSTKRPEDVVERSAVNKEESTTMSSGGQENTESTTISVSDEAASEGEIGSAHMRKYQTINRHGGSGSSTTETIHYKAIVRDNDGVHLREGSSSTFFKNFEEAAQNAERRKDRINHAISRGGKIAESDSDATSRSTDFDASSFTAGLNKYKTINRGGTLRANENTQSRVESTDRITEIGSAGSRKALFTTTTPAVSLEDENVAAEIIDDDVETTAAVKIGTASGTTEVDKETTIKSATTQTKNKDEDTTKSTGIGVTDVSTAADSGDLAAESKDEIKAADLDIEKENIGAEIVDEDLEITTVATSPDTTTTTTTPELVATKPPTDEVTTTQRLSTEFKKDSTTKATSKASQLETTTTLGKSRETALRGTARENIQIKDQFVRRKTIRNKPLSSSDAEDQVAITRTVQNEESVAGTDSTVTQTTTKSTRNEYNRFDRFGSRKATARSELTVTSDSIADDVSMRTAQIESVEDNVTPNSIGSKDIYRGTYRPREEGDLSSLLALDINKPVKNTHRRLEGVNIRRRPVIRTSTVKSDIEEVGTVIKRRRPVSKSGDADSMIGNTESASTTGTAGFKVTDVKNDVVEVNREKAARDSLKEESEATISKTSRKTLVRKRVYNGRGSKVDGVDADVATGTEQSTVSNSANSGNLANLAKLGVHSNTFNTSNETHNSLANNALNNKNITGDEADLLKTNGSIKNNLTALEEDDLKGTSEYDKSKSTLFRAGFHSTGVTVQQREEQNEESQSIAEQGATQTGLDQNQKSLNATAEQTESDSDAKNKLVGGENSNKSTNTNRYSARSRFGSRSHVNSQVHTSGRSTNRATIENDTADKGKTRTRTSATHRYSDNTYSRTNVQKTTVEKEADDYEYVYEVITEVIPTTTRRPITRNRGVLKFQSNDLSSLLALDIPSKYNRRIEGPRTIVKTRRRLIKKPAKTIEIDETEEREYESDSGSSRPPPAETTPTVPTTRRTRPTRPLRTTTQRSTTEAAKEETHSTVASTAAVTTRKGFAFRKIQRPSTTETPATEATPIIRRKVVQFKKRINSVDRSETGNAVTSIKNTTEEPSTRTTEQSTTEQPTTVTEESTTTSEKPITTTPAELTTTEAVTTAKSTTTTEAITTPKSTTTTTTEAVTTPKTTTTTEAVTTPKSTTTTTTEAGTTPKSTTTTSTEAVTTAKPTTTTTTSTTTPSSILKSDTSTKSADSDNDSLDKITRTFVKAVKKLKSSTENETAHSRTNNVPSTDTENKVVENSVISTQSATEQTTDLSTSEQDLSLPIYHRRKYYQYYKDSPIIYVGKTVPPTADTTSVDIRKQIHDVFNISNNHLITPAISEEAEAKMVKEQAEEINSELSHFLLKTPGS